MRIIRLGALCFLLSGCMTTTHTYTTTTLDPWTDEKTTWVETVEEPTDEAKVATIGSVLLMGLLSLSAFGGGE